MYSHQVLILTKENFTIINASCIVLKPKWRGINQILQDNKEQVFEDPDNVTLRPEL